MLKIRAFANISFNPVRRLSSLASDASSILRFCVVGSGPAGFYTVDKLLKKFGEGVQVDLVDRLPTPFGLVRSGVAPDHQDTKNVINQYTSLGKDPRVSYFGNVALGKDVSLQELRSLYHGVVLAYGAESDRKLGIPGEAGRNVFSAREFVWWYNGHPDAADLPIDLSKVESVAVCGIGNVALDCARVLLQPYSSLTPTDIASHALRQLLPGVSRVRNVHVVARRGPVQAACTPKELKELVSEAGIRVMASPEQLTVSQADQAEMKATRMKRRIYDLIKQGASKSDDAPDARQLHFQFYRNPSEVVLDAEGNVCGLKVEKTKLKEEPGKAAVAVGTGEFEALPVQLVLVSIGYKSLPVPGLPFDARKGIVPNQGGKVLQKVGGEDFESGLYVCGWLKRGPTGIIGTNLVDAEETVACLAADFASGPPSDLPALQQQEPAAGAKPLGGEGLRRLLTARGVAAVDFDQWLKLDAAEVAAGQTAGRVREKVVRVPEMLSIARS